MTCGLATALEPPHFNHAPVRGAIGASFSRRSRAGSFNPRTRVGCDQCVCVSCLQLHCVSIHAPAWGATFWGCKKPRCIPWFQSTHSRGVRLRVLVRAYSIQPFQSTHPRGVRQECVIPYISPIDGFNPRTRVGCDSMASYRPSMIFLFQSTHPRGVRPMRQATSDKEDAMFQSTHPRGVRRTRRRRQSRLSQCFNPRTRVGCDSPPTNRIFAAQEFQSTHPRGVRLAALLGLSIRVTVSIHAPAWGATTSIWQARNSRPVSIHAPAWGATCRHVRQRACLRVSIHAPAWGATPAQPAAGTTAGRFQSTHPRGVRLALIMGLASINKFQSTHPRGVRPMRTNRFRRFFEVSIHAPAWGATGTSCPLRLPLCGFNPRTRVGCDA